MKTPRNIGGEELVKKFRKLGYVVIRQTGSHIRLMRAGERAHHLTVPKHKVLKIGTLHAIIRDAAAHLQISKEDMMDQLWG